MNESPEEPRKRAGVLGIVLWVTTIVFLAIMVWTWIAAERANPVLLDLETGKPVTPRSTR